MALSKNFGTPKTASGQVVNVTGTVPIGEIFAQSILLDVLRDDESHDFFSITKEYDNSAGLTDLVVNDSINMTIVPKVGATETVTATYFGSLEADIELL